jgi:DNA processing protein
VTACDRCLRRTRLIAELAGHLDHLHAERGLLDEVFALRESELVDALVPEGPARQAMRRRYETVDLAAERNGVAAAGLDTLCRHDAAYPAALCDLAGPPAVLFGHGLERLGARLETPAAAIVGARRASAYGVEVARSLARGLSAAGVTVVSGMAMGVDSAAHEGALDAGGRTIAVLGSGPDVPYPATKRALHRRLMEEATVVSELPPGFRPRRWTFPARNRIIAALAHLTVVVEAGPASGALITARIARDAGRDVGAVPGQVTSPLAGGPNALLRDGAHLVDGPQAVLDLLFGVGTHRPAPTPGPALPADLAQVLEAVREGRDTVAALTADPGRHPPEVMATLAELELRGLVRRAPGGAWVAVA